MRPRKSSIEIKGEITKYLLQGLTQTQIGKIMNMSKQAINYWMQLIRKEEQ